MYARSDWLRGVFAWEYVNMVVASRCFAFRALITQARIWKSFRVQNSTSLLYLPIPSSAETWKIVTKKVCQFFFAKADILSAKSPYFWKVSFSKTRTDYACKTLANPRILPTPLVFISGYANTENVYCLNTNFKAPFLVVSMDFPELVHVKSWKNRGRARLFRTDVIKSKKSVIC